METSEKPQPGLESDQQTGETTAGPNERQSESSQDTRGSAAFQEEGAEPAKEIPVQRPNSTQIPKIDMDRYRLVWARMEHTMRIVESNTLNFVSDPKMNPYCPLWLHQTNASFIRLATLRKRLNKKRSVKSG